MAETTCRVGPPTEGRRKQSLSASRRPRVRRRPSGQPIHRRRRDRRVSVATRGGTAGRYPAHASNVSSCAHVCRGHRHQPLSLVCRSKAGTGITAREPRPNTPRAGTNRCRSFVAPRRARALPAGDLGPNTPGAGTNRCRSFVAPRRARALPPEEPELSPQDGTQVRAPDSPAGPRSRPRTPASEPAPTSGNHQPASEAELNATRLSSRRACSPQSPSRSWLPAAPQPRAPACRHPTSWTPGSSTPRHSR